MRIEPLNDQIVVRRLEAEEKTAGGIVLPDSAREKQQMGRVVAVGSGRLLQKENRRMAPQVGEGDRVVFSSYAGTEISVNNETLLILAEGDILAVLE